MSQSRTNSNFAHPTGQSTDAIDVLIAIPNRRILQTGEWGFTVAPTRESNSASSCSASRPPKLENSRTRRRAISHTDRRPFLAGLGKGRVPWQVERLPPAEGPWALMSALR